MIPVGKAVKIVGGAFVAVLFVAAVWIIYSLEAETAQRDVLDAGVLYGSFVFTLFIASAILLAVFAAFQWAKDGPKERRVASVVRLYLLLCGLIFLSFLPFDTFKAGSIAPIAIFLGFGVGVGVFVMSVFGVVRGILRRPRPLLAHEEEPLVAEEPRSQLAEAEDQSRIRVRIEEEGSPPRRVVDVMEVLHHFWQRQRLRAELQRPGKERRRAEKRQLAEERRQAKERAKVQRRAEKRRQKQEKIRAKQLKRKGLTKRRSRRIPQAVKIAVAKRDNAKCRYCGSRRNLQYDHIRPYSRGGSSMDPKNIQLLCARCNHSKGNFWLGF